MHYMYLTKQVCGQEAKNWVEGRPFNGQTRIQLNDGIGLPEDEWNIFHLSSTTEYKHFVGAFLLFVSERNLLIHPSRFLTSYDMPETKYKTFVR